MPSTDAVRGLLVDGLVNPEVTRLARAGSIPPRLTIGLPVYNGERYLARALDALLAQTYPDFELVISDNASTDATPAICRRYLEKDDRIRYVRQPTNIGAAPNHNVLVDLARGEYFKWASHDDLYEPGLVRACVEALEAHPEVVLAHCADAGIDDQGELTGELPYLLNTHDPRPAVRLWSLLMAPGGNDFYGVIRTEVLRRVGPHGSYYNADRTFMAALVLQGPFFHVSEVLYYRRDHPDRASRAGDRRAIAATLDPRRSSRLRHPMVAMHAEYLAGFVKAVRQAPLGSLDRVRCIAAVGAWLLSHVPGRMSGR